MKNLIYSSKLTKFNEFKFDRTDKRAQKETKMVNNNKRTETKCIRKSQHSTVHERTACAKSSRRSGRKLRMDLLIGAERLLYSYRRRFIESALWRVRNFTRAALQTMRRSAVNCSSRKPSSAISRRASRRTVYYTRGGLDIYNRVPRGQLTVIVHVQRIRKSVSRNTIVRRRPNFRLLSNSTATMSSCVTEEAIGRILQYDRDWSHSSCTYTLRKEIEPSSVKKKFIDQHIPRKWTEKLTRICHQKYSNPFALTKKIR